MLGGKSMIWINYSSLHHSVMTQPYRASLNKEIILFFSPTSLFNSVTSSFPWLVPFSSVWQFQHELASFNMSKMIKSVPINCFSMLEMSSFSLHLSPPLCFDALAVMAQALQSIPGLTWDVHLVSSCTPLSVHWGFLVHPGSWHFTFVFFSSCDRNEVWTWNFMREGPGHKPSRLIQKHRVAEVIT